MTEALDLNDQSQFGISLHNNSKKLPLQTELKVSEFEIESKENA